MTTLPRPIAQLVDRHFASGEFPALAELPQAGSRQRLFLEFESLALGDLEQLVEYHRRRAYLAVTRFERTGSRRTASTAAGHIWRAERYRMRYRELLDDPRPEEFVDSDPVFPEFRR